MEKRTKREPVDRFYNDEILPEYDFSGASRNKYASRYSVKSIVVVLDPDVAAVFPTSREANEALRALAVIIRKHRLGPLASGRRLSTADPSLATEKD